MKEERRDILCVDLKSFYASVECVERGLDPFKTPLVVADTSRGGGSIVLAVSPYLKKRGVPSRCRVFELPKDGDLVIAKPRMRRYLEVSRDVVAVYLSFVAPEDLHVYSIDEAFLDLTPYRNYYDMDARALAARVKESILKKTEIPSSIGIGDNLLQSKLALDLKSKQSQTGIAAMRYETIEKDLWPLRPLSGMWGIGRRMERRLNALGMFTVGDIARFDVEKLHAHFGIIGSELYHHAHGIDRAVISKGASRMPLKSVGLGQTLFEDYTAPAVFTLFLEMADDAAERLRFARKEASTVHLAISYSKAFGGGFSRQMRIDPTDSPEEIFSALMQLFRTHDEGLPVRRVTVRASGLSDKKPFEQLSLFTREKDRETRLMRAMDYVREKYGKRSAMRLSSYFDSGTAYDRATLIGGHHG